MLTLANQALVNQALADAPEEGRSRLRLVAGSAETAAEQLGRERFDGVLCPGVRMDVDDPVAVIAVLGAMARPDASLSLMTKNGDALAMRPARAGRFGDAPRGFGADRDLGGMGVPTTAPSRAHLAGGGGARRRRARSSPGTASRCSPII